MERNRVTKEDTLMDVFMKVSEQNPGAVSVLMKLYAENEVIDPDSWVGPLGTILDLDATGIYGAEVYMLYTDVCQESIPHIVALFRAKQFGYLPEKDILAALREKKKLDLEDLMQRVQQRLPRFNMGTSKEGCETLGSQGLKGSSHC